MTILQGGLLVLFPLEYRNVFSVKNAFRKLLKIIQLSKRKVNVSKLSQCVQLIISCHLRKNNYASLLLYLKRVMV